MQNKTKIDMNYIVRIYTQIKLIISKTLQNIFLTMATTIAEK